MILIIMVLISGLILVAVGIFQMKYYFGCPHEQDVKITGSVPYKTKAGGLAGLAADAVSSVAGVKRPVVDVTLDDGSLKTVPLNTAVTDQVTARFPELDFGGEVTVLFFGNNPKIAYLINHALAQKVLKVSAPLLCGIALLVLGVVLLIYYFSIDPSTI